MSLLFFSIFINFYKIHDARIKLNMLLNVLDWHLNDYYPSFSFYFSTCIPWILSPCLWVHYIQTNRNDQAMKAMS